MSNEDLQKTFLALMFSSLKIWYFFPPVTSNGRNHNAHRLLPSHLNCLCLCESFHILKYMIIFGVLSVMGGDREANQFMIINQDEKKKRTNIANKYFTIFKMTSSVFITLTHIYAMFLSYFDLGSILRQRCTYLPILITQSRYTWLTICYKQYIYEWLTMKNHSHFCCYQCMQMCAHQTDSAA